MNKQEMLNRLSQSKRELEGKFAIQDLAIFGSLARDEATGASDVDVLVKFKGRAGFDQFMDLKFYLEDLIGAPVDLVTDKALRPILREKIKREAIYVT